ncbi:MAG: DUF2109 domain-containing protein [Methanobacteriaceae archaeon]
MLTVNLILGIIIIFMAIRTLLARDNAEKLLYINVIGFASSALIALYIATPFGFVVASTFFICSTLSSNAIAYTLNKVED